MRTSVLLIASIVAIGMMASCASDSGSSPSNTGEKATVNLSFATGGTRTTTATDDGGTIGNDEGTVNNVAFGLFDANGYRLSASYNSSAITDYNLKSNSVSSISVTATSSASKIIAIANVPSSEFAATNSTDYVKNYVALLSNTTSADGTSNTAMNTVNSQQITGLPMYGEQTISFTTNNSSTSASPQVALERMVARVCITGLYVDLSSSSDASATFTPTEIFMYNVNDKLSKWSSSPDVSSDVSSTMTEGTTGACEVTGTSTSTPALISTLPNTAYLSSGLLSLTGTTDGTKTTQTDYLNVDKTSASAYSFYVFPHSSTNPTKIVIKGVYTSTAGTKSIVYYPVIINHKNSNTTFNTNPTVDSQISPNTLYNLSVAVKGRGVSDPSQNLEASTVAVTMTVTAWSNITQTVTIQ